MSDDLPIATSAIEGGGGAAGPEAGEAAHRRRLANYLLDRRLQLRYVIVVTLLSVVICGSLGTLIYRQEQRASYFLEQDLKALTEGDASLREFQAEVARDMESRDDALVGKMVGAGCALVLILSVYLLVMTHKVAGPLYKISMYFDKMSAGRFVDVTPLRRGDMLQDFFSTFQEMSAAIRGRMRLDLDAMERAAAALRAASPSENVVAELQRLDAHIAARRAQLP